jgi:GT2 family glycosyltransferase
MTRTAIVILNWNGMDHLRRFMPVVVKYSSQPGTEIYLADNGSTDGSAEWVVENTPTVKLIRLGTNYGFADGYNRALEQIDSEYYILLNSDIEVTPGWTDPLIRCLDEDHHLASCQPKILSFTEKESFEYAGAAGGFIDKYGYPFCRGRIFDQTEKDQGQYDSAVDVFWTSGACMAVRSATWKRCGGFDGDFFAHMEEIDLCWRMNCAGYRLRYVPESTVYHVGGGALPYESAHKTYLNFRNNLYLLYKNLPDRSFHKILFTRKFLDGIAGIRFLLTGNWKNYYAVLKAHIDYYRNMKSLRQKREEVKTITCKKTIPTILNKSIVFEFYIRGKKTFDMLSMNN